MRCTYVFVYPSRMNVASDQTGGSVDVWEAGVGHRWTGYRGGQLGLVLELNLGLAARFVRGRDLRVHQARCLLPLGSDLRQDAVCTAPWWWRGRGLMMLGCLSNLACVCVCPRMCVCVYQSSCLCACSCMYECACMCVNVYQSGCVSLG